MIALAVAAAADTPAETTTFVHVAQAVNLAVLVAAVAVLAQRRRIHRGDATNWALAMFAVVAAGEVATMFPVEDDGSLLRHGYTVALICVLLLIPYLFVRFAYVLGAVSQRVRRFAVAVTVAELGCTLVSPPLPQPGEPRSGWVTAYIIVIVVGWTLQSVLSAFGLWVAGKGQPSVIKHRMRTLATGAVVIVVYLVARTASDSPSSTMQIITTMIGVVGIALLVLAFVVPAWLRSAWGAADLEELGKAERVLMTAATPQAVADAIVPALVRLFGARGAAVLDGHGRIVTAQGLEADELARLNDELSARDPSEKTVITGGGFASRLGAGWVVVEVGILAPVFGVAELSLHERAASYAGLAMERSRLFEQEAISRRAAEAANAELQTLLYSVSHDLRNPILSVLGYLDVLHQEHAGQLRGEGERYLQRISVNAVYMQNLIQDLLELSRIGRSEPAPQAVDLGALADSVAQEVRMLHPGCDIAVTGSFPVVSIGELRARQLLTNLLENAASHAEGEPHVMVKAVTDDEGGATVLVSDDGVGIPGRHRQKAFEVFERLSAADKEVPGTGMGLPICKRIVESVGGSIVLAGPADGASSGTTVRLTLPASVVGTWSAPLSAELEHSS